MSYSLLLASRVWKYVSLFCTAPVIFGWDGLWAFFRKFKNSLYGNNSLITSKEINWILLISWLVLKPSKKCKKGKEDLMATRWAIKAKSWASWGLLLASMQNPVCWQAITSWWSAKMHNVWVESARVATWITAGKHSPAILYIVGSIKSNPCELVKVEVKRPEDSAPCIKEITPFSECIWVIFGRLLKIFNFFLSFHW